MDIKMKCFYKRRERECKHRAKYSCYKCQTPKYFCKKHAGNHQLDYMHEVDLMKNDFRYFKKQIKSCISDIAKKTEYVIAELNQTSLKVITELKIINKNVKTLDDLNFISYDSKRISFLVEQASCIHLMMDEISIEKIKDHLNLLKGKDFLLENHKSEIENLSNTIEQKETLIEQEIDIEMLNTSVQESKKTQMVKRAPSPSQNLISKGTN